MNKKAPAIVVITGLLAVAVSPAVRKELHPEPAPPTQETGFYAEYMDAQVINTHSGTVSTLSFAVTRNGEFV